MLSRMPSGTIEEIRSRTCPSQFIGSLGLIANCEYCCKQASVLIHKSVLTANSTVPSIPVLNTHDLSLSCKNVKIEVFLLLST